MSLKILDELKEQVLKELYLDKFFTSHTTIVRWGDMGIRVTGTIKPNKTNMCSLLEEVLKNQNIDPYGYPSDSKIMHDLFMERQCATVIINTTFDSLSDSALLEVFIRRQKEN